VAGVLDQQRSDRYAGGGQPIREGSGMGNRDEKVLSPLKDKEGMRPGVDAGHRPSLSPGW